MHIKSSILKPLLLQAIVYTSINQSVELHFMTSGASSQGGSGSAASKIASSTGNGRESQAVRQTAGKNKQTAGKNKQTAGKRAAGVVGEDCHQYWSCCGCMTRLRSIVHVCSAKKRAHVSKGYSEITYFIRTSCLWQCRSPGCVYWK